jgi:hypothetical protein
MNIEDRLSLAAVLSLVAGSSPNLIGASSPRWSGGTARSPMAGSNPPKPPIEQGPETRQQRRYRERRAAKGAL